MLRKKRSHAGNPAISSIFTADPSAHVWQDGKIYIYASHDMDPARGCDLMDHYHVYSSSDMANWIDEGEILNSDDVQWGRPEGGFMWAPDCAYRKGKYYFYYPHPSDSHWNDSWKIGVAVSENPSKDYKDLGFIEGLGGFGMIDPCVFIDEDDQAYMYYGGATNCLGGKLNEDMLSLDGEMKTMEGLEDFHEAAWVFKRKGMYYLMYSDNVAPCNNMRYAMSKNPLGPWEHKGIMLTSVGCETTHGSIACFKDEWYLFYHNQEISGHGNLRSVCIDKIEWNEEDEICLVTQTVEGVKACDDSFVPEVGYDYYPENNLDVSLFLAVDGGNGGRASLCFYYDNECNEEKSTLTKMRLHVNEEDGFLINLLGNKDCAEITVNLRKGNNRISLAKEMGNAKVTSMDVVFLDKGETL
ncbi:family 43 glycosylhydrolase [Lachnospiraceae bacterium OttesenSCG-928-D06]|nr:family 43 glycosylhydrolase [Lachnospiraceae bacterium OttesenSCG-928-D06]